MPAAGVFEVRAWGDLVGEGQFGARHVTLDAIAKGQDPGQRIVANEYMCSRLALYVGLPCPPGVMLRGDQKDENGVARPGHWFVLLKFGRHGQLPHPALIAPLVANHPDLVAGISAFDAWTWNGDRHPKNIAYRPSTQPVAIFDHGLALGGPDRSSLSSLPAPTAVPPLSGSLQGRVTSAKPLSSWASRIKDVGRWAPKQIGLELVDQGVLTKAEATQLSSWLQLRSVALSDVLRKMYPHLTDWGLTL